MAEVEEMGWKKYLKEAIIESVSFSGAIALAIFIGYGLVSWDWYTALYLGASVWLVFWMVIFCGELLTGESCT